MNVQELYQKKLTTAAEAVKAVKSGDWVDYGWCTNHPYTLDKALAARQSELRDVKVRGGVTMWMPEICQGGGRRRALYLAFLALQRHRPQDHRQGHGLFLSHALLRAAALLSRRQRQGGRGDDPGHADGQARQLQLCAGLPRIWRICSTSAKTVIVEVNENLPWVYGLNGCEINIKDVDMVVEGENPARGAARRGGGAPHRRRHARWRTWSCRRSPTVPACSSASAVCPTPSAR